MKLKTILITVLFLLCIVGFAQANLVIIGTAEYDGNNYKLIYDDDDTGYGGGGLVWLDYTHSLFTWQNQKDWASGLGSSLTVTLNPGYTTSIDWESGWRLPDTVDGLSVYGHEGDPDNDGIYTYTRGCNLANSEMGHLFSTELGNLAIYDTSGNFQSGYGLQNTGDFDYLIASWYWSGTEFMVNPGRAWGFRMGNGYQYIRHGSDSDYGLAVHSGHVSTTASVPVPATIYLLSSGLIATMIRHRRRSNNQ